MKRTIAFCILNSAFCLAAHAALPTLSGLADAIEEMRTGFASRLAETSNRLAKANARIDSLWDVLNAAQSRIDAAEARDDAVVMVFEGDQRLREAWHGGKIGTYVVTNESGRLISVSLYGDATAWTNGVSTPVRLPADPERRAKELARLAEERERLQAAWEAANLPPDLAALRAAQREAARQAEAAE